MSERESKKKHCQVISFSLFKTFSGEHGDRGERERERERGGPNHRAAEKVVGSRANGKSTESFFLQLAVSATTER